MRSNKFTIPKSQQDRRLLKLSYIPISKNIYYDGSSFRVRVTKEGHTTSISTTDKNQAIRLRNNLLGIPDSKPNSRYNRFKIKLKSILSKY